MTTKQLSDVARALFCVIIVCVGCAGLVLSQAPPTAPRLRISFFHSDGIVFSGSYQERVELPATLGDSIGPDCRLVAWHPWFGTDTSREELNLLSFWADGSAVGANFEWDKHFDGEHGEKEPSSVQAIFPDPGLGGPLPITGKFFGTCINGTAAGVGCGAAVTAIYYWRCPAQ